jgi:glycosyltransferase involved in cell wall biosynthesis
MRLVRARAPRLVHAHFGRDAVAAAAIARSLRVPLLVTIHGWELAQPVDRRNPMRACHDLLMWRAMRALFTARSVAWIAVSAHVASALASLGAPSGRISTLPIGVDLERFVPHGAAPVPGRILFLGRLVPIKACDVLIRAVSRLRDAGRATRLELRIAGDGPEREAITDLARGLPVVMLGRLAPEQVRQELACADLLCVPSRTIGGLAESFGIAFAEAQAMGVPVVSTRTGGIPEAVADGETGLLVPPDDPDALAEAITAIVSDRGLRARFSAAAASRTARLHGLAACTAALEDLYDSTVAEGVAWA